MEEERFPIKIKLTNLEEPSSKRDLVYLTFGRIIDIFKDLGKRSQIIAPITLNQIKDDDTNPACTSLYDFLGSNYETMLSLKDHYPLKMPFEITKDAVKTLNSILKITWNSSIDEFYNFCKEKLNQNIPLTSRAVERILGLMEVCYALYAKEEFKQYSISIVRMQDLLFSPLVKKLLKTIVDDRTLIFTSGENLDKIKGMNTYFYYTSERIRSFLYALCNLVENSYKCELIKRNNEKPVFEYFKAFDYDSYYRLSSLDEYFYLLNKVIIYPWDEDIKDLFFFNKGLNYNIKKIQESISSKIGTERFGVYQLLMTNKDLIYYDDLEKTYYLANKYLYEFDYLDNDEINILPLKINKTIIKMLDSLFKRTKHYHLIDENKRTCSLLDYMETLMKIKDGWKLPFEETASFKKKLFMYAEYFKASHKQMKDLENSSSDKTYGNFLLSKYIQILFNFVLNHEIVNQTDVSILIDYLLDTTTLITLHFDHYMKDDGETITPSFENIAYDEDDEDEEDEEEKEDINEENISPMNEDNKENENNVKSEEESLLNFKTIEI